MDYFRQALSDLLQVERGYVNDPKDPGGETNYGITKSLAMKWGYQGPMKDIPMELVEAIYRTIFWDGLKLDRVAEYCPPLASELFEAGVNCGAPTVARWLQTALSALGKAIVVDGFIGDETLGHLEAMASSPNPYVGHEDLSRIVKLVNVQQGARYLTLALHGDTGKRFIRGWLKRVKI